MSRIRNTTIRDRIVNALTSAASPKSRAEIFEALGGAHNDANGKYPAASRLPLASMVAEGIVVQEGHKRGTKYRLPTT